MKDNEELYPPVRCTGGSDLYAVQAEVKGVLGVKVILCVRRR